MNRRPLGHTGLTVSAVGFGTWGLGGTSYGPVDDTVAAAALNRALDLGVDFFDTADMYGDGRSEELLGRTFCGRRDRILLATKGGNLPHTGMHMPQDFSPRHLAAALEHSLRRLQTDYVDLYQLHSPTLADLERHPDVIPLLRGWIQAGKIRTFGISVRSPADGIAAIQRFGFPVIQVNFNMIDQRAADDGLFALARKTGTGIIARTPLVFGYLTGNLTGTERFVGTDHRANWPGDQRQRWAEAPRLFDFLAVPGRRSLVQACLRFCLDQEAISTVIPGMMSMREVEENAQASGLEPLTPAERQRIAEIYRTHDFYDPSAKRRGRQ